MKYYAVYQGHKPGIYRTWNECQEQINGYSTPIFQKFTNLENAELFVQTGNLITTILTQIVKQIYPKVCF